jgi:hypothetical protein
MVLRNLALCALLCLPVMAQAPNPLVGAWERISLERGGVVSTPPPEIMVIGPDGYYCEAVLPEGRDKSRTPLNQMTKEELLARFSRTEASWGIYTITGNFLHRQHIMYLNPNGEGSNQDRNFHFEGDILVLTTGGPGDTPQAPRGGGRGPSGGFPGGGRGGSGGGPRAGGRGGSGGGFPGGGALVVRFKRMKQ